MLFQDLVFSLGDPILKFLKFLRPDQVFSGSAIFYTKFFDTTRFFISNTFIGNTRLKLAKNQANGKQHLLFEFYSHSSFTLSS